MHLALIDSAFAPLHVLVDLPLESSLVVAQFFEVLAQLESDIKEDIERSRDRMHEQSAFALYRHDSHCMNCLSHANFLLFELPALQVDCRDNKVELIIVEVLAEANMIDRVRKDPLEFNHDVDSRLSVLACRDVSKPLVTGHV